MQTIIINRQLLIRKKSSKDIKKKNFSSNISNKKKIYRSETNLNKSEDIQVKSGRNLNKSCDVMMSKNNKVCLSDNEIIMKNKESFLEILKNVTTNMILEMKNKGNEVKLQIEPEILPEAEKIIKQNSDPKPIRTGHEISSQEVVINYQNDNKGVFTLQNVDKNEERDYKNFKNTDTNEKNLSDRQKDNDNTGTIQITEPSKPKELDKKQYRKQKESTKCKCHIF